MTEIIQPNVVYYDIDWDKVKTIKDLKTIIQILATKVVIDHQNDEDIQVYNILKKVLVKCDDQNQ